MEERTEPARDVQSIREMFQSGSSVSFSQEHCTSTNTPSRTINNIRSNPTINNVMDALELSQMSAPPPVRNKPKVPSKPGVISSAAVPDKRRVSTGSIEKSQADREMKVGFRHTLHIADPRKKDGNGMRDPKTGPPLAQSRKQIAGEAFYIPDLPKPKKSPLLAFPTRKPDTPFTAKLPHHQRKSSLTSSVDLAEPVEFYESIDPCVGEGQSFSHPSLTAKHFTWEQSRSLPDGPVEYETLDPSTPPLASSSFKLDSSSPEDPYYADECYEVVHPPESGEPILFPRVKLNPDSKGFIHEEAPKVSLPIDHALTEATYETADPYIESPCWKERNVPTDKSPPMTLSYLPEEGTASDPAGYELYETAEQPPWDKQEEFGARFRASPAYRHDSRLPSSSDKSGEKDGSSRLMGEATDGAASNNVPKRRHLSPSLLLGPLPPKPPRPPSMILQLISTRFLLKTRSEPLGSDQDKAYGCPIAFNEPDVEESYEVPVSDLTEDCDNVYETNADPLERPSESEDVYETAMDGAAERSISPPPAESYAPGGQGRVQSMKETRQRDVRIGKSEQALRKRYQITGSEIAIYTASVTEDVKGGKDTLSVTRGEMVEIIQNTNCPAGKWLARSQQGNYGYIPVDVISEYQDLLRFHSSGRSRFDCYDDVGVRTAADESSASCSYSEKLNDVYDDAICNSGAGSSSSGAKVRTLTNFFKKDPKKDDSASISPTHPRNAATSDHYSMDINDNYNRDKEDKKSTLMGIFRKATNQKPSIMERDTKPNTQSRAFAKEESLFRDRFKYTADIVVCRTAVVTPEAALAPKGKYGLAVTPGESLDVIDVSAENLIICRNSAGKFGYVSIEHLV